MTLSPETITRWRQPKIQAHCFHGIYRIEEVRPNWTTGWPWVQRTVLLETGDSAVYIAECEKFCLLLDADGQAEEFFGFVSG